MAYTLLEYNALLAQMNGNKQINYGDKMIQNRSLDEMIRLKKLMEADLGIAPKRSTRRYASVSKGLNQGHHECDR